MEKTVAQQLKEAELAIAEAEKQFGPDHPELADRLMKYANLLRETDGRKLDAVNIEARAKAIRAKIYAEEADKVNQKVSTVVIKPKQEQPVGPGVYVGLVGCVLAVCGLFVNQANFMWLAVPAIILVVFDVVATRGGGWWRALLGVVLVASGYYCMNSIPANMLTDASPMERFNYGAENPKLVENVRRLGEATTVHGYSFSLPEDYSTLDYSKPEWGESYEWRTPARDDGSQGIFRMMIMRPDVVAKNYATLSLAKIAHDVAVPQVVADLGMTDVVQQKPKLEDLNELYFARVDFTDKENDQRKAGVIYAAKERDGLLVLVCLDFVPQSEQTIPQMEAIVYTFHRASGADSPQKAPADKTGTGSDSGTTESDTGTTGSDTGTSTASDADSTPQ
jgi:hypothetical protein